MAGECGTYAGWNQHVKLRESPCEPCREAQRIYMRSWRERQPTKVAHHREKNAARSAALTRLSREFQGRFAQLYDEELTKRGLS